MMKKFFAIFLALTVVPTFQTYAWIGGPFSNNSHTPNGDDGIYEAVAIPRGAALTGAAPGSGLNGVGLYRWGVTNNSTGTTGGEGNVLFGSMAFLNNQHVWYLNGAVYYGMCFGTVNSIVDTIHVVGSARDFVPITNSFIGGGIGPAGGTTPVTPPTVANNATSHFTAKVRRGSYFFAGRNFQGSGRVSTATALDPSTTVTEFRIIVFGSRVSHVVTG
jgi:hypothetical protein